MNTKTIQIILLLFSVSLGAKAATDTTWVNKISDYYYGFESGIDSETGWWMQHPDNWSLSTEKAAPGGTYSLKYTNATTASGQLKAHGSSSIDDMSINLDAGDYTIRALVWVDPAAEITGVRIVIKKPWTIIDLKFADDIKKGEWVELSKPFTLNEAAAETNMLVIMTEGMGGKGTLYVDNIMATNGEKQKPTIPYFTRINTVDEGNLSLDRGIYEVEMSVYKDAKTTISSIFTMVQEPFASLEWKIDTVSEDSWITLKQELTLPKDAIKSDFTVHINNHPLYGGGTGSIFIDDIKFNFIEEFNTVKHVEKLKNYKVYPNPSSSILNLETEHKSRYVLYNMSGSIVSISSYKDSRYSIDVSKLPSGIYFLQIAMKGVNTVEKIQIR